MEIYVKFSHAFSVNLEGLARLFAQLSASWDQFLIFHRRRLLVSLFTAFQRLFTFNLFWRLRINNSVKLNLNESRTTFVFIYLEKQLRTTADTSARERWMRNENLLRYDWREGASWWPARIINIKESKNLSQLSEGERNYGRWLIRKILFRVEMNEKRN